MLTTSQVTIAPIKAKGGEVARQLSKLSPGAKGRDEEMFSLVPSLCAALFAGGS
jgi:hypothetical protein